MRQVCIAIGVWLAALACVAEDGAASRVLFDFEAPVAERISGQDAAASVVAAGEGHALEIRTDAAASWPGVTLRPDGERWDLTGCNGVAMDVYNPEDVPVRVLLRADNPGADGTKNCNTAAVNVQPGKTATVAVRFGINHGNPAPLDTANIVSLLVFLDRPGRGHTFRVDAIRTTVFDRSRMDAVFADAFFRALENPLGRGINLGNALDAPKEGEWGVTLEDAYFEAIARAGFDSVRIPCRWSAHAADTAPFTIDPEFLARVDHLVAAALEQDLHVVLNIHHYGEIMKDLDGHRERCLALWRQIAAHFRDAPPELWFELLNEPNENLKAGPWNVLLNELIPAIRETNPERILVVGSPDWNSVGTLDQLELPEADRNLVVTFHYYNPFRFTHQGASWVGAQSNDWVGTEWTGTAAEKEEIIREFDAAIEWGVRQRRPLYLGEFGAYSRADMASRARWTRYVAEQALERKIGFAYWEFCSGFGAYDAGKKAWIEPLRDALVPRD